MIFPYPKLGFVIETETVEQANNIRDNVLSLLEAGLSYGEIKGLHPVTFSDEALNTPVEQFRELITEPITNPEPQEEPKKAKKEVINNETY
jgi:hypothetical protein